MLVFTDPSAQNRRRSVCARNTRVSADELDRIAERRARAVRFDVADRVGRDAGDRLCERDHFRLSVGARRRVADLGRSIVVDRAAADHRDNRIARVEGVLQPLQDDDADAVAADGAGGGGVEGAAVAVGRRDAAFLIEIARRVRHLQRHAAREREVALVAEQALTRELHGDERRRARRLHRDARSPQVQLVGDVRGQRVLVVGDVGLVDAEAADRVALWNEVMDQVRAEARAGEEPDGLGDLARRVARALERFPDALEEQAVLRVEHLGLARREAEERGVEALDVLEERAGRDELRMGGEIARDRRTRPARRASSGGSTRCPRRGSPRSGRRPARRADARRRR